MQRPDQQLTVLARVVLGRRRPGVTAGTFTADKSASFADLLMKSKQKNVISHALKKIWSLPKIQDSNGHEQAQFLGHDLKTGDWSNSLTQTRKR